MIGSPDVDESSSAARVDRICAPDAETFERDYLSRRRPVILTDLYAGQPIGEIRDEADALARLGEVTLGIREEFTRNLRRHGFRLDCNPVQRMTLAQYLSLVESQRDTALMCSEQITPPEVRALFEPPPYRASGDDPEDTVSMMFLGNEGNFAQLHFDGDHRHVLLYQVFGVKRFTLFPPEAAVKLATVANFSTFSLADFDDAERSAFVAFAGGCTGTMHPGDTLYFPACWWHHFDYLTLSMACRWGFGRTERMRFIAEQCHMSARAQNAAALFGAADPHSAQVDACFEEVKAAYRRPYASAIDKGEAMEAAFERVCERLGPQSLRTTYLVPVPEHAVRGALVTESQRHYQPDAAAWKMLTGWEEIGG